MANYCEVSDIQFMLGHKEAFSADSTPTSSQVTTAIEDVTGEIDFELQAAGISVQPTNANLLKKLSVICKNGVACQVGMSQFGNNDTVNDSQPNSYCENYKDALKDISDNPAKYGLVTGDENIMIGNNVTDGTNTESEINDMIPDNSFEY
jgi:hypothetical protein